ncbi:MAG: TadE/TadG family type IV pilus assembly protein [Chloroflexota bacterium]
MIFGRLRARCLDHRGQSVVEFALILPALLLVLFGITEFGRAFQAYLTVNHIAREGARLAAVGATNSEIEDLVYNQATGLDPARLTVTVSPADQSARNSGMTVTVRVTYDFRLIVPLISDLVGSGIPMAAALSMRIE